MIIHMILYSCKSILLHIVCYSVFFKNLRTNKRTCYKTLVYKTHFVIDLYTACKKLCLRIMIIYLYLVCNLFILDSKLFAHSIFDHLKQSMESLSAYLMSFWNIY